MRRMRILYQQGFLEKLKRSIYKSIPGVLKKPIKRLSRRIPLPYSWRMNSPFCSTYNLLRRSQHWSKEQAAEYQLRKLKEIICYARENTPGYRKKFAKHKADPAAITSLADIRRFPCLNKEDLRQDPQLYVAENIPRECLQYVTSGGTTGTPTGFYHILQYNHDVAEAFRLMMWRRIGYRPHSPALDLTASFGGRPLRYAPDKNTAYFSISCLDHQHLSLYAEVIGRLGPEFIIGFPSSLTLFAQLVKDYQMAGLKIRGIIASSEVMYEHQHRYISEVFGCRILQWYGLAEYAAFASGCEYNDEYHFFPEAGYMELLDEQDRPVTEEDREGEIVLTGFYNWATPFIRYRTGDRAVLGRPGCHECDRNYPLLKRILGRVQEFLVARNGRLIPNSALNLHSGLFDKVWRYQFYQDAPGEVILKVVKKPSYDEGRTEYIRKFLLQKLGEGMELKVQFVEEIPRTERGKHKFIIQKLSNSRILT